jgi:hypothetical protein
MDEAFIVKLLSVEHRASSDLCHSHENARNAAIATTIKTMPLGITIGGTNQAIMATHLLR